MSISISSLSYLVPSAHQRGMPPDEPEKADKSCLFGLELFKLGVGLYFSWEGGCVWNSVLFSVALKG